MIWATVRSKFCLCWVNRAPPSLAANNLISLIAILTIWWRPCAVMAWVVEKGCLICPVCSLDNTLLNLVSFCTPRPNLPIILGISWLSYSSVGKESTCNAGDPGSIPGSGRSPGEGIGYPLQYSWTSLVAQLVKNPPAMQETPVQFLGQEDPLEKGKATHSSILAWRIPWTV